MRQANATSKKCLKNDGLMCIVFVVFLRPCRIRSCRISTRNATRPDAVPETEKRGKQGPVQFFNIIPHFGERVAIYAVHTVFYGEAKNTPFLVFLFSYNV